MIKIKPIKQIYKNVLKSVKDFAGLLGVIAGIIILVMVKFALIYLTIKGTVVLFVYAVAMLTSTSVIAIAMVVVATVVIVEFIKNLFTILKRLFTKESAVEIVGGDFVI